MTTPFFSLDEQQIKTLSQIAGRINESEDILSILDPVLAEVIGLAGLQSGWILLRKNHANKPGLDSSFSLAAQHNLPPDINADTWRGSCACQELCECGQLGEANHLVTCDRFTQAGAAWPELQNHVSIPLCSSETLYGLLNATTPKGGPSNRAACTY